MEKRLPVISIVMGIIFGLIAGMFHFSAVPSLVLWTVGALSIGYLSPLRKNALINGALFGFFVSFFFMWAGYTGVDPVITKSPFFAGLGGFGAGCGLIISFIAFTLKPHFSKKNPQKI